MQIDKSAIHLAALTLTQQCFGLAAQCGWWTDLRTSTRLDIHTPRLVIEKLCLVHSEISEALEGHRKDKMDEHLPDRKSLEVEMADAVIRLFDMAGGFGLDLGGAIADKLAYNAQRADHKLENRKAVGGKAF